MIKRFVLFDFADTFLHKYQIYDPRQKIPCSRSKTPKNRRNADFPEKPATPEAESQNLAKTHWITPKQRSTLITFTFGKALKRRNLILADTCIEPFILILTLVSCFWPEIRNFLSTIIKFAHSIEIKLRNRIKHTVWQLDTLFGRYTTLKILSRLLTQIFT